ncbi:ADP-ribosyl-[dinitrogen reductase] glycohydrolase [uncultured Prevotella sp.]|uniref:ADP-ribosylglycohydrolase family protein n=1 Tax=uncultured Prevotella sp. TaxID=159272 RepID=UPI001A3FE97B|nr:ADP-ribosylglycohydrolase family protein [uncultured Prevotella sp.]VTY10943.1 ADP-ribosyl-[dinitrogen reductase] glycohydrolase [uncultured Prevotella sp.]
METKDKIYGTIFGQAIGDALGLGTEFMSKTEVREKYPDGLKEYSQIIRDYHRAKFQPGSWSDDTDMMLCIANAIIEDKGINLHTIARNFKQWVYAPETRGVGQTTLKVLSIAEYVEKPHQVAELIWRMTRTKNAANGSVMRTAIIGLKKENVAQTAEDVCKLTHFDPRCVGSCVIVSEIINHLIWHDEQLSYSQIITIGNKYDKSIAEYIDKAYYNGIESLELDEPSSIGYTLKALGSALWCLFHANDFEEGLLRVVNEGGDADTNAAVACAMLGAKFGYTSIPQKYTDGLTRKNDLMRITNYLMQIDI